MALHYWQNMGLTHRTRFVHLVDSYHGDTSGAMSVSDIDVFKSRYRDVTFQTYPYDGDPAVLQQDDVAAVIVEPIVQAAAGMRIVPHERYDVLRGIEPLLIVDEIATGFGRTGTMFACEQLGLRPDIVCVGKGLTGGTLALSATVVRDRIYDAFRGAPGEMKQFFHGHSYAGNPIACAAAIANLDLFEAERTLDHVAVVAQALLPSIHALASHPLVREVRQAGLDDRHRDRCGSRPVVERDAFRVGCNRCALRSRIFHAPDRRGDSTCSAAVQSARITAAVHR